MIAQFFFFWGKDVWRSLRGIKDTVPDRHHQHMVKTYKEVPWWWYISVLVISFIFGLIVVLKEDVTLSAGGYVISLVIGSVIAPMVCHALVLFVPGPANILTERITLRSIWQWHCYEQSLEDDRRPNCPRAANCEHVLRYLVSFGYHRNGEHVFEFEAGRIS